MSQLHVKLALQRNPVDRVQAQLDAYNAHDLEAFVACYSPDAVGQDQLTGEVMFRGREQMRAVYGPLFDVASLRAELTQRVQLGGVVVDRERVFLNGDVLEAMAIYEVRDDLISRVWFVKGESKESADSL